MDTLDVAVVGAGPFGLSVAAHLQDDLRVRLFGAPMRTWRTLMPPDMRLRSDWEHTNLSALRDRGTLQDFIESTGTPRREPIPLSDFLAYAEWFRTTFVREHDAADVVAVEASGAGFRLGLASGDELEAARIVIAVGVIPFANVPHPFRGSDERVATAVSHQDFDRYAGKRVVVVGGGQNALESGLLAHRAGAASVELLVRSHLRWFAAHEPFTPRGELAQRLYRLAYPVVGFGPPPINRIATHPDAFARLLPPRARVRINRRLLRPGGSPWIRDTIDGAVPVTEGVEVASLFERPGSALLLQLSDGTTREVDAVILATGYRFDVDRLAFLHPSVRAGIRTRRGWPVLDRSFRSSDPRVLFVGFAAEERFGPLSRYVEGTRFSAPRVARALRQP